MTCFHPVEGFQPVSGGSLVFERPRNVAARVVKVPCRHCVGCLRDREIEWAVRMMHEAQMHEDNWFVTLTYDDEHIPRDYSLCHPHFQKFMRRLRKALPGLRIRFFVCGEYGPATQRPHYHAAIFGLPLSDLELERTNYGNRLYGSEFLDSVWRKGHCVIGQLSMTSAAYIAGYLLKDAQGGAWKDDYEWTHIDTGEIIKRDPPYARMSNRPGLGKDWFTEFHPDVFPKDYCHVWRGSGRARRLVKVRTPGYYKRLLQESDPALFDEVKEARAEAVARPNVRWNNTPDRLKVRETIAVSNAKKREKSL